MKSFLVLVLLKDYNSSRVAKKNKQEILMSSTEVKNILQYDYPKPTFIRGDVS